MGIRLAILWNDGRSQACLLEPHLQSRGIPLGQEKMTTGFEPVSLGQQGVGV